RIHSQNNMVGVPGRDFLIGTYHLAACIKALRKQSSRSPVYIPPALKRHLRGVLISCLIPCPCPGIRRFYPLAIAIDKKIYLRTVAERIDRDRACPVPVMC